MTAELQSRPPVTRLDGGSQVDGDEHGIAEVRIGHVSDGFEFVILCDCGWQTDVRANLPDANTAWQGHRDADP